MRDRFEGLVIGLIVGVFACLLWFTDLPSTPAPPCCKPVRIRPEPVAPPLDAPEMPPCAEDEEPPRVLTRFPVPHRVLTRFPSVRCGYFWETFDDLMSIQKEDDLLRRILERRRDASELLCPLAN